MTPQDFLDLGSRAGVDQTLSRLVRKGTLHRVDRGIYTYPKISKLADERSPKTEAVAKAMARRGSQRLLPAGMYAAKLLGLTDKVPARVEYLTDGPSRQAVVGHVPVVLKKTTPKNLAAADRVTGVLIQALRFMGRPHIGPDVVETLRQHFSEKEKNQLLRDVPLAPAWMGQVFRQIALEDKQDKPIAQRDDIFWKNHHGIGLVWSNPNVDDNVMIAKALLQPNFHLLLDIADRFGFKNLKLQWDKLRGSIEQRGYPEELRELNRAKPIVLRSISHMEEALK